MPGILWLPATYIAVARAVHLDRLTGAPFDYRVLVPQVRHPAPALWHAHHFRLFTSFIMRIYKVWSATILFSSAFSRSSSRSRFASGTSMPPNSAFQR